MSWREVRIAPLGRARLQLVTGALFALGTSGTQESELPGTERAPRQPWDTGPEPPLPDRVALVAWFDDPDVAVIERALRSVLAPEDGAPVWADTESVDWEAQARSAFAPIRISARLVVAPPWDAPPGALVIEPGQGFGTGAHPSTRQALAAIDALDPVPRTVLDVGCGSGILALAAARLGAAATGVDIAPESIREARANAIANGLTATFSDAPLDSFRDPFELVVGNLHAELIAQLAPDLERLTAQRLVLAGILADREHLARAAITTLALAQRSVDGEWVSLQYERAAGAR